MIVVVGLLYEPNRLVINSHSKLCNISSVFFGLWAFVSFNMSIGKETDESFIYVPAPRLIRWVVLAGPGRFEGAVAFSNVCMRVGERESN